MNFVARTNTPSLFEAVASHTDEFPKQCYDAQLYELNYYSEKQRLGEKFDSEYKKLWLRERRLVREYNSSSSLDEHDRLFNELCEVRQAMTNLEHEFD